MLYVYLESGVRPNVLYVEGPVGFAWQRIWSQDRMIF